MSKIPKASAGYQFRPETNYTCGLCVFLKDTKTGHGCSFFGPSAAVSDKHGSCIYFSHSDSSKLDIPWLSLFTKQELGYEENLYGFTCARCEYFQMPGDCRKVDRRSPGDTPGEISPHGCCSLWERSGKRGGMSDAELVQILAKAPEKGTLGLRSLGTAQKK